MELICDGINVLKYYLKFQPFTVYILQPQINLIIILSNMKRKLYQIRLCKSKISDFLKHCMTKICSANLTGLFTNF